jgi:alcohol dehydrogenase
MQLGACWAGFAIENSMLGAAHACANPLTARYGTDHGVAVGLMLPYVVRWNSAVAADCYRELLELSGVSMAPGAASGDAAEQLASRLDCLLEAGRLPVRLRDAGVAEGDLEQLAKEAGNQWTGRFNPRPFGVAEALELYRRAY